MADYSKPRKGDPLKISADTWGAILDATAASKVLQHGGRVAPARQQNPSVVTVKNASDTDRDRFDAMQVDGPIIHYDDNEEEFKRRVVVKVVDPTDAAAGRWCVLQEPLKAGAIGEAVFVGVTVCVVDVQTASDTHVEVFAESNQPRSSGRGSGQLLWVDGGVGSAAGTGPQLAIVKLGGDGVVRIKAKITGATVIAAGTPRWRYSFEQVEYQTGGRWQALTGGIVSSTEVGYAYNNTESNNTSSGVQGNGINLSALAAGYNLVPAGVGAVVELTRILSCDEPPIPEWTFDFENAVQGTCP